MVWDFGKCSGVTLLMDKWPRLDVHASSDSNVVLEPSQGIGSIW